MELVLIFFIFFFGLIIGSFLNVIIYRIETGETVVVGRSHCRDCKHVLEWYDLVPVLSFLALGAKCRYCKKSLSMQYPIVEIATAILFILSLRATIGSAAISGLIQGAEIASSLSLLAMTIGTFIFYLFIISALIVIFFYDLRHYIIPDKIVYPAIVISLIYLLFSGIFCFGNCPPPAGPPQAENLFGIWDLGFGISNPLLSGLFAAVLASAFFLSLVLITRGKGMGGGDVKLAFLMGLVLGWPNILFALFLAFAIGAIYGIILIALRKKTFRSEVPFGPFLAMGTAATMFWGGEIAKWYLGYLF